MRRITLTFLTLLFVAGISILLAYAQNPHFLRAGASLDNAGNLDVSFKIAGLGSNESIEVTATADARAIYACRNKGDNCPNAANKSDVMGQVFASGLFQSGKNGQITDSLEISPPATTLTCPGNQTLVLVFVEYSNVMVQAGDATRSIPGTFSRTTVPPNCAAQFGL